MRDASGGPDYFTTQVVDVTRQRAAEAAQLMNLKDLEVRTTELEFANADLGRAHHQASDLAAARHRSGLYIVSRLLEANDGTIEYQSPSPGVGGLVVTLPQVDRAAMKRSLAAVGADPS